MALFGRKVDQADWWKTVHALRDELATHGHETAASILDSALTAAVTASTELYYECFKALEEILRLIPKTEAERRKHIKRALDDGRSLFNPRSSGYLFRR